MRGVIDGDLGGVLEHVDSLHVDSLDVQPETLGEVGAQLRLGARAEQIQPVVAHYAGDWFWQAAVQPFFLEQPAWLVVGVVAIVLILLGRKKKPLIGYARE